MKTTLFNRIVLLSLLVCPCVSLAGDLNPPAAPGPTMKTLDEVEPRIPISKADMPLTIDKPGSYYFTEPITWTKAGAGPGNAAIDIQSNNVTIDMKGFSLTGSLSGESLAGIYAENKQYIRVLHGAVMNFANYCIYLAGESGWYNAVDDIQCQYSNKLIKLGDRSSAKNCKFYQGTAMGLWVGSDSIVSDCTVRNILKTCADGIRADYNCIISNCTVNAVTNVGIAVDELSIVKDCVVNTSMLHGIYASSYATVSGCTVRNCQDTGISGANNCLVENCNATGSITDIYVGNGGTARGNFVNGGTTGIHAIRGAIIEDNQVHEVDYGIKIDNFCTVRNNNVNLCYSVGVTAERSHNMICNNCIKSEGTARKGVVITGDDNFCLDNKLINETDIVNSGTNNKISGNITF